MEDNGFINELSLDKIRWKNSYPKIEKNKIKDKENFLEVKNLSFAYKKNEILKNLNFSLKKGEIVSLIGKNGAGKTTFLKLISKALKKYYGDIFLENKNIRKINYKKYYTKLALLFQNPENHFLYNSLKKELDNNISLLDTFNIDADPDKNPFLLSEGEKRRLSIAILFNLGREIFLLDEPTFGQDYKSKLLLINLIQEMKKREKTFLIVTHDLSFAYSVSDKIYELKDGKIYEKNK